MLNRTSRKKQAQEVAQSLAPAAGEIAKTTFNVAVAVGSTAANIASPGTGTAVGLGAGLVGNIFTLAETIYQIARDAQHNKAQCLRLADSVAILCRALHGLTHSKILCKKR